MRKLLTPRWLALHALALLMIAAFILLAYWQVQRGEAGNARSWGYAFQWPAFGIFVIYMWIRMAREELHPNPDEPRQATAATSSTDGLRPAGATVVDEDEDDDPELDAELEEYNQWLARLNERAVR